jgi:hypothetical protein
VEGSEEASSARPVFSKQYRVDNLGGICDFEHASDQGNFEEHRVLLAAQL